MNKTYEQQVKNDMYEITLGLHQPAIPPCGTRIQVSGNLYRLAISGDADAIAAIKDTLFASIKRLNA